MPRAALTRLAPHHREERGAVAIVVALCMTMLCVVAALVLDFGLVKVDRQVDKSAADASVLAGLHAMDFTRSNSAKPFVGVCSALRFLKANQDRFSGLSESTGWSDGTGSAISGNPCTTPAKQAQSCSATNKSTWAQYDASQTVNGLTYAVHIQNGYDWSDASGWKEDSLAATTGDHATNPCMDMELTVSQSRRPGLGSLATTADLQTGVRTVGRVTLGSNGDAPAMLLLRQHGCSVNALINGGSGFIHVKGVYGAGGQSQGGTIHSDDDAAGCGTGGTNQVFYGRSGGGIAAYAAPSCATCTTPDATKPGVVSSVAGMNTSTPMGWIVDSTTNVYGASGVDSSAPGTTTAPIGRDLVTRQPVDSRYKAAVQSIISSARTNIFSNASPPATWATVGCNASGAVAAIPAYDSTKPGLWINCPNAKSAPTISGWKTVVFSGRIQANNNDILMPDATKVYVFGNNNGVSVSGTGSFQMHTTGRIGPQASGMSFSDSKQCVSSTITSASDRGLLVVNTGGLNVSAFFRACDTTVVMVGNDNAGDDNAGCVPTYDPSMITTGPAPTSTPCASANNGGNGTGQVNVSGDTDWTAPNECTVPTTTTCDGVAYSVTPGGWSNPNGPEDLALWSESYATSSGGTTSRLGGSTNVNVRGVFMTPNFDPLVFGGGGTLNLVNAQFVAAGLANNGGASLTMTVDPNSAVKIQGLQLVGLVR